MNSSKLVEAHTSLKRRWLEQVLVVLSNSLIESSSRSLAITRTAIELESQLAMIYALVIVAEVHLALSPQELGWTMNFSSASWQ
jgi:hypothetical protein